MRESYVIDISCANTEDKVKYDIPKVDPPQDENIKDDEENNKQETSNQLPQDWIFRKNHLLDNILENVKKGVSICLQLHFLVTIHLSFLKFNRTLLVVFLSMRVGFLLCNNNLTNLKGMTYGT